MDLMARARRYGEAVAVIDEYLGSEVRERVMSRFSQLAGPLQRGGLRDPWEMIARSAKSAGVKNDQIQALRIAYLLRIKAFNQLPDGKKLKPEVVAYLAEWGIWRKLPKT